MATGGFDACTVGFAGFFIAAEVPEGGTTVPIPVGRRLLWDNSNIVESYPGVVAPLTFSFARSVYEEVYRRFYKAVAPLSQTISDMQTSVTTSADA